MSEETNAPRMNGYCDKYNFHIDHEVDEILICYGGVNSYEPRDPIAINTGNQTEQVVTKSQGAGDRDQHQ